MCAFWSPLLANAAVVGLSTASLATVVWDPRPRTTAHPLLIGLLCFLGSTVVSVVFSIDRSRSMTLSVPFVPGILLYLLISRGSDVSGVRTLFLAYVSLSIAMALYLLGIAWSDPWVSRVVWTERAETTLFVVPNDVIFFASTLPMALALLATEQRQWVTWLARVAVLLNLTVIVVFQSRGGCLTAIMVAMCWAARRGMAHGIKVMGLLMLFLIAVDAANGFALAERLGDIWSTRLALCVAAIRLFQFAPLVGTGPRTFALVWDLLRDVGGGKQIDSPWTPFDWRMSPWAHNLYLETLAEQGLVGVVALVVLLGCGAITVLRVVRSPRTEVSTLGLGTGLALLAIALAGTFELSLLRLWVVIVLFSNLGVLVALDTSDASAHTQELHQRGGGPNDG